MTESNQGPATPGTAARDPLDDRCPDCGRGPLECEVLLAMRAGLSGFDVHARLGCAEAAVERLKAENASLLESLRAAEKTSEKRLTELTKYYEAHGKECLRAAAAEQIAEAAENEAADLREALGDIATACEDKDLRYFGKSSPEVALKIIDYIHDAASAALHDEERPQWFASEHEPVCGGQKSGETLRCLRARGHEGRHSAINHNAPDTSTDWRDEERSAPPQERVDLLEKLLSEVKGLVADSVESHDRASWREPNKKCGCMQCERHNKWLRRLAAAEVALGVWPAAAEQRAEAAEKKRDKAQEAIRHKTLDETTRDRDEWRRVAEQRAEAIAALEQSNTELEKARRAAAKLLDEAEIALCAHSQPVVPRTAIAQWLSPLGAALHDEERSAPPQEEK